MEMAFYPLWTFVHNAEIISKRIICYCKASCEHWAKTKCSTRTAALAAHSIYSVDSPEFSRTRLLRVTLFLPFLPEWIDDTLCIPLQRWCLSPDRRMSTIILLRCCCIRVYGTDLYNATYFLNDCLFYFFRGFEVTRAKKLTERRCWWRNLEWWWCGFWPSRFQILTILTAVLMCLCRLTRQRLNGRFELHGARS